MVATLEGYAEVSPSGTGVHVIVRGAVPNRQDDRVEAYSSGRYFTVTGRAIFGHGLPPPERQEGLPEDLRRWVEHQRSAIVDQSDIPLPQHPLLVKRAGKRLLVRFVADNLEDHHLLILEEQYIALSAESLKSSLGLTNREAELLLGIAQGKTNKAIAEDLYVSPLTVKTHLQRFYRKLGVESRAEALSMALLERLD